MWQREEERTDRDSGVAPEFRTIGLVRFSVLTPTYYSERFKTLQETAAHLFSPARMELRFRLFERLCLPSMTGQGDGDFRLIVLAAEAMPKVYLERLHALLEPHDNISLRLAGPGKHYAMLREAYQSVPVEGCSHRIMFRLDDDDAVDRDFIARSKRLARGLFHLHEAPPPTIIAYNRGFYLRRSETGSEVFDAVERAPLSAISLGEVLATSDVPGGVVNILTGSPAEIAPWLAAHADVNALDLAGAGDLEWVDLQIAAAETLTRVLQPEPGIPSPSLDRIGAFVEIKTVWHTKAMR